MYQGGGRIHCVWWSQTDPYQVDCSWGFELWQVCIRWRVDRLFLFTKFSFKFGFIHHVIRYTSLCDVWSFGVLAWEIFSKGGTPYQGMTNTRARELIDSGYRMPAPDGTPDEVYQLMLRWIKWMCIGKETMMIIHQVLAIRSWWSASLCWNSRNSRSPLFPVSLGVAWVRWGVYREASVFNLYFLGANSVVVVFPLGLKRPPPPPFKKF